MLIPVSVILFKQPASFNRIWKLDVFNTLYNNNNKMFV